MTEFVGAVAASNLVNGALLAALIPALVQKGVLTHSEAREIYEQALLLLETAHSNTPDMDDVFGAARELIEKQLPSLRD